MYLKELAHEIVGLASVKSVEQGSKLETQTGVYAAGLWQNFFSGQPRFFLLRPLTNWRKPTYIVESNHFYLTDCKLIVDINHIYKNTFTETPRLGFDGITGYYSLAKVIDITNHQTNHNKHGGLKL